MKLLKTLGVVLGIIGFTSCNNEQSLQQYYVANQSNKEFIAIDVPASMLTNVGKMNEDQRKALESIKKINVLAIPKNAENQVKIESEKENIFNILQDEKYQLLMKYGGGESRVEVYFTGNDEAIDELIVYGFDTNRGMGIARVLGDKMNPGEIMSLMSSLEKGDLDLDGLSGLTNMFIDKVE